MQLIEMFRSYFKSFCRKSTIHGFAYIGHSRYNFVEKIFWMISLGVSLIFTVSWISELIRKLNRTPIVVAVDDTPIHVSEINFPSMTICPGLCTDVQMIYYDQFVTEIKSGQMDLRNFTELELERLQVISIVKNDSFLSKFNVSISTENFITRLSDFFNFYGDEYFNGKLISRDLGNFTKRWHVNFTEVLGRTGLCFTFNFPTSEKFFKIPQLSNDFNYTKQIVSANNQYYMRNMLTADGRMVEGDREHVYPLKTIEAALGLLAEFRMERGSYNRILQKNQYFMTNSVEDGFHLTFHDPFEIISRDSPNYFAIFNRTSLFKIIPKIIKTDDSIASFSPEKRGCYLPEEKILKYFKVYNKINCEHECLANLTLATCRCVQFFMVRNESTTICGVSDWNCFTEVDEMFSVRKSKCKCLSSCKRIDYSVEMKITDYNKEILNCATVEVKFSDDEFFPLTIKRLYTDIDLIAFTGGLLGLFAGLSALSVIEIIYFFTLRLVLDLWKPKVHPIEDEINQNSEDKNFLKRFLEKSSVHGLFFIVTEDRKIEKIFWIFAFAVSISGCTLMSIKSYEKFSLKATFITQDSGTISVSEINFPAITFTGAFEHSYEGISTPFGYFNCFWCFGFDLSSLRTMVEMFVCKKSPDFELESFSFGYTDFVDMLLNITLNSQSIWFEETNATWLGESNPKYVKTLTINGIGFTFNTFDAGEILNTETTSKDFAKIQSRKNEKSSIPIPWSNFLSSVDGFKIYLNNHSHLENDKEMNYRCKEPAFLIHSPYEMPLNIPYSKFTKLLYGTSMEVLIKPEIIKSDENIKEMDLEDRKCYFADEYQLKYFKHYTKYHCDLEVLSEMTYEKCGCVPFNYIRNDSMDICNVTTWRCAISLQNVILDGKGNTKFSRHCLPLCDSITYDMEFVVNRVAENFSSSYLEEVKIDFKFKEKEVSVLKRYRQFPAIDFLSTLGGLLGLFAGVSFFTILETFYLLIVRPISDLLR